ncbi:phospholipase domain-containing protein [Streptomyces violascens]|uniref:phospholipase domain-containing protein n=1 Tax=Streptomyces violascens TaxID=67381 RepID=UPI001675C8A9|nr:phospholipase domain-containing protein [Streptomyces violascens]
MRHATKCGAARWAVVLAAVSAVASTTAALPAKGPRPSVAAVDDCARGGVDVTASNGGDAPFTFQLAGVSAAVDPGRSRTILVPVADRQSYRFTVLGPGGFRQDVSGVLDCATASPSPTPSPPPSPTSGADRAVGSRPVTAAPREAAADGRRLAIAGVTDLDSLVMGTVLVLLGAMLFVVRRLRL